MKSTPRTRKLDESLKEALASILETEVTDPRLELVTITGVSVSPDMRHARVWVTTHGDAERYAAMLAGLAAARGRMRRALSERVRMKFLPELVFELDESVDEGERIERALRQEAKAERRLAKRREASGAAERHSALEHDPTPEPGATGEAAAGTGREKTS